MKKLLLSVVLIASALTLTFAQNDAKNDYSDYSKWSFAVKGGLTYYRVTPASPPEADSNFDTDYLHDASWGTGVVLERTANPLFGMGLAVDYNRYNRRPMMAGFTIDPTLFGAVNVSNLFFPHRTSARWNVYAKAGAGVAFYAHTPINEGYSGKYSHDQCAVFTGAIHPEVNLGKSFELGLEITARYYSRENLGAIASKDRFDDAMTAMGTLRYKFGSKPHTRNLTMDEFYPVPEPVKIVENVKVENPYDDARLINRLNNLDKQNQNIQDRLAKLENDLKNLKQQPIGTSIDVTFENIEFEFDSANLTDASYEIINHLISILKGIPTWSSLKVDGYTDSIGSEAYNQNLSEARVNSVKDYLVSQGIDGAKITTEGFGESNPIATNSTSEGRQRNRRVTFHIVK